MTVPRRGAAPDATPEGAAAPVVHGSWDRYLRVVGYSLLYGLLLTGAFFTRPDMPLTEKGAYLGVSALVGVALVRLAAGWRYAVPLWIGIVLAAVPVQGLLLDDPVPRLFVLGLVLGMLLTPVDEAKRDARRARSARPAGSP